MLVPVPAAICGRSKAIDRSPSSVGSKVESPAGTGMFMATDPLSVRSMSWSMNWPQA